MVLMLITTVWLGTLGFLDDYIKTFKHDKEGLHGKFKIIGQVGLGLIVGLTLYLSPDVVIRKNIEHRQVNNTVAIVHESQAEKSTQTTIPFFKNNNLDYADLVGFMGEHKEAAGWVLFVLVTIFVVTAVSNGANLNDGMDGMAAGNSAIIGVTLGILAYVSSHIEYASYLNIMYIPGSEELVIFICAFIGALIGFLCTMPTRHRYSWATRAASPSAASSPCSHHHPQGAAHPYPVRRVPRGEPLGHPSGALLQEWEKEGRKAASVQADAIHDHFRTTLAQLDPNCSYVFTKPANAFHESKITVRFWIVTIVLAAITIITLKIR